MVIIKNDPDKLGGFKKGAELTFEDTLVTLNMGHFTDGTLLVFDEYCPDFPYKIPGVVYRVDRIAENTQILSDANLSPIKWVPPREKLCDTCKAIKDIMKFKFYSPMCDDCREDIRNEVFG